MSVCLVVIERIADATDVTDDTVSIGAEMVAELSAGLVTSETVADATGVTGDLTPSYHTMLSLSLCFRSLLRSPSPLMS